MKKRSREIRNYAIIILWMLIMLFLMLSESPVSKIILVISFLLAWSVKLFLKINHRIKSSKNTVRFPRVNDQFYRYSSIVLGVMTIIGAMIAMTVTPLSCVHTVALTAGLLIFLNGLFYVPTGKLCVKKELLETHAPIKSIPISSLSSIRISKNHITLAGDNSTQFKLERLSLTEEHKLNIAAFFKYNSATAVITCS